MGKGLPEMEGNAGVPSLQLVDLLETIVLRLPRPKFYLTSSLISFSPLSFQFISSFTTFSLAYPL